MLVYTMMYVAPNGYTVLMGLFFDAAVAKGPWVCEHHPSVLDAWVRRENDRVKYIIAPELVRSVRPT